MRRIPARIRRRIKIGFVVVFCAAIAFSALSNLTHHSGETVILLMLPVLAAFLWTGWPNVRDVPYRAYVVYLAVMTAAIGAAEAFAAHMARGRVLWVEVFWALYFVVAWRLAWAVYKRTVGTLGERLRRWGRRARREAAGLRRIADAKRRRLALLAMLIGPARFCAVVFVFAPLVIGALVHRIKIGNASDLGYYADLPIENVSFETEDRLTLSGWFLPEEGSNATVVICHGSGANKGNFIDFLALFHTQGYSGLIFDARGHGDSDGHTSTFGLFEVRDVRAAVDWLKSERADYASHVYGLGSSMGAMTLVRAAAQDERIEAVVLDSCFASAPSLARQHAERVPILGPVLANIVMASMSLHAGGSLWSIDGCEAIAAIAPRPVLLIHGKDDFVIPPNNMDALFDAAGEPKQRWLAPGLHSNILTADFTAYQERVLSFLNSVQRPERAAIADCQRDQVSP